MKTSYHSLWLQLVVVYITAPVNGLPVLVGLHIHALLGLPITSFVRIGRAHDLHLAVDGTAVLVTRD